MTRKLATWFAGFALCSSLILPSALAQESTAQATPATPAAPEKSAQTPAGSSAGGWGKTLLSLPGRLAVSTVGACIGTPIAAARITVRETKSGVKDWVGESSNPFLVAPLVGLSFPYAVVSGAIEGPMVAARNAWESSDDKPFGKDAFSLGDIDWK